MTLRTLSSLFLCAGLLCGCDQGVDPGPAPEFRETTSCLKTGTTTTTLVVKTGVPNDWEYYREHALSEAPEQADEIVLAVARADVGNERLCSELCEREDLGWTGENCIVARDYEVGEMEEFENGEGEPRFRIPVYTGLTTIGCACE